MALVSTIGCPYQRKCGWVNQIDKDYKGDDELGPQLPILLSQEYVNGVCYGLRIGDLHLCCPHFEELRRKEGDDLGLSEQLPGLVGMVNGITTEDGRGSDVAGFWTGADVNYDAKGQK